MIIAFAFLATGLKYGLAFFISILLVGTLMRFLVKRFRLLYLPRMAIVLTVVALAILIIFFVGAHTNRTGLVASSIFAVLIMITLVEKFVAAQIERGAKRAIILTTETLILSVVSYWVVSWPWLQSLVLTYPLWVVLGAIVANILLGKWTGLRLTEYFRFREAIRHMELPKKK